ncbi:MAG: PEP-CTERM sorting domain-containing protein [Microcystaceae cyanobacterium]
MITLAMSSSWSLFTTKALADIRLTAGTPKRAGIIEIRITGTGGRGSVTRKKITIPRGTTAVGKAELIDNALNRANTKVVGNKIFFPRGVKKFQKLRDTTGETTKLKAVKKQKAKEGRVDGSFIETQRLSGVDDLGNESTFFASLGFETKSETILASSQLLFSELGGSDIDDWLSSIFTDLQGQLPEVYQPNLSLDLNNDFISFIFPDELLPSSGSIANGTTDINASSSLELEVQSTPEPNSILTLLSLGVLGTGVTLKRKIKRFHSIEKDPTNVS